MAEDPAEPGIQKTGIKIVQTREEGAAGTGHRRLGSASERRSRSLLCALQDLLQRTAEQACPAP